ncbi:MAG: hypothetical protein FWC20_10715 [Oscillospiraceae bacterium]|nr:hypothetical protein [Oscillospiraceae bacterium]MCL2279860.1 hypothetical protein [Oscillospiraceae bacterium]
MKINEEAREEFRYVLEEYILRLLPVKGSLVFKEPSSSVKSEKHIKYYKSNNRIHFYPSLTNSPFYFRISSETAPNTSAVPNTSAAEDILREILRASQYSYNSCGVYESNYYEVKINGMPVYKKQRFDLAFEVGLSHWLGGTSVYRLLEKMHKWSQKTYEGKKMPFSFIIDAKDKTKGNSDYIQFLDSPHSAVFTDGMTSGIALDNSGLIVKYFSASEDQLQHNDNHLTLAPYRFIDFANMCYTDSNGSVWIGVIAQSNGDILVFKRRQIVFAKRSGTWFYVDFFRVFSAISMFLSNPDTEENKKLAKLIYLSILDVSFSRVGGCIAIIDDEHLRTVQDNFIVNDDLDRHDERDNKKKILTRLITACGDNTNRSFFNISQNLRQDLLSLDGATLIDRTGKILGVGAIVRIDGGSDEGGG